MEAGSSNGRLLAKLVVIEFIVDFITNTLLFVKSLGVTIYPTRPLSGLRPLPRG